MSDFIPHETTPPSQLTTIPIYRGICIIFDHPVYFTREERAYSDMSSVVHPASPEEAEAILLKLAHATNLHYMRACPCDAHGMFQPED